MKRRAFLALSAGICTFGATPFARAQDARKFKPEELDQMLAPIALYPDALLSQILMAAGYPLEIVEAARWSKANPGLKGDAAVQAVKDKDWDTSVKSLVAFPDVLATLNEHLDWTQKLGDAMIAQESDVADSIQRLRAKAAAAGNLKSTPQQTVTTQGSGDSIQYVIQPANPEVIYVPSYSPSWAYGPWPYPAYPPVYYPFAGALATGFFWGLGFAAAGAMFSSWNWAGRGNSYVNVNVNRAVNIDNHFNRTNINTDGRWRHDPEHRKGVGYRDPATRERFNQAPRPGIEQRNEFRGRLADHPGSTNRPDPTNRPQAGNHPQLPNRPGAGGGGVQRPNLQQRQNFNRSDTQRPSAIGGVNRGQQINHQAQRGQQQINRAQSHTNVQPRGGGGGGGGGGGARGGGGGFHGGGRR
jgi:hypothetical protein